MKVVVVEVLPLRDTERVQANIVIEERRGDHWAKHKVWEVMSGTPQAARRIILEDNQRLVIEAVPTTEVVYDPEQKAAVERPIDPVKRREIEDRLRREAEKRAAKEREAELRRQAVLKEIAAARPLTNIGAPVEPAHAEALKRRADNEDRDI